MQRAGVGERLAERITREVDTHEFARFVLRSFLQDSERGCRLHISQARAGMVLCGYV